MDESDVFSARSRRKRVERGKRSKNGCRTCVSKRVKCGEERPFCQRCVRLQLACEWTLPRPSLSSRRRGLGPIKHRHGQAWTPPSILPNLKPPDQLPDTSNAGLDFMEGGLYSPSSDDGKRESAETPSNSLDLSESAASPRLYESSPLASFGFPFAQHVETPSSFIPLPTPAELEDEVQEIPRNITHLCKPTPLNSAGLPVSTIPNISATQSPSTFGASPLNNWARCITSTGTDDNSALCFHRMVFAPLKSTRSVANSAQSLFINYAIDKNMALHFLLAVAHSELALYYGNGLSLPRESYAHFDRGSKLLCHAPHPRRPADHINMMLSFLYMYMFWMRRDPLVPQKLQELSRVVVDYVQTHDVDAFCTNDDVDLFSEHLSSTGPSIPDQVLLARIFTYLYDRDSYCSFFGCGGSFATYVNVDLSKVRKIWTLSRTIFLWFPGDNTDGAFPEIYEASVLDLYFKLITMHHEINIYSQNGREYRRDAKQQLWLHLNELKCEYSSTFSLVIHREAQSTQPSLMACVTVAIFYALQIYLHRSRDSVFGTDPICYEVRQALSRLVVAAYQAVATGPVQLLERFQWSLFIAGIETRDPVHKEWLANHIFDPGLKSAFKAVQGAKEQSKVTMETVRRMTGGKLW
ncbi:hypothetical protein BDV25DRAFT_135052 [Aspergillus avenaceus]|uniref:Zn(2)-C6 fungal-type domain-containing protein n=1 Tax=Aspergillus avenaceus TaxID=36643 RepID=A0A5N6U9M0_ASPAV|nr:hypothetical protein BDV25DRAFT_135052 [Aspergillus avenaceus]